MITTCYCPINAGAKAKGIIQGDTKINIAVSAYQLVSINMEVQVCIQVSKITYLVFLEFIVRRFKEHQDSSRSKSALLNLMCKGNTFIGLTYYTILCELQLEKYHLFKLGPFPNTKRSGTVSSVSSDRT